MAWTAGNPVAIGDATKKAHYDALWNNADMFKTEHETAGTHKAITGPAGDPDGTLAANSDNKLASQKATKTYMDARKGITWVAITGDTNAAAKSGYLCDTNADPITLTLPASPSDGDPIYWMDAARSFATNNLTIARNGKTIGNVAENMVVNTNGASGGLVYYAADNNWGLV